MGPNQLAIFWLILSTVSICTMIFGIRYLNNRENMALIERGMDPSIRRHAQRPAPFLNLKWGLLLMGAGLGLFCAYLLDNFALEAVNNNRPDANVPIYFALIAVGGGAGLIVSFLIERKAFPPEKLPS